MTPHRTRGSVLLALLAALCLAAAGLVGVSAQPARAAVMSNGWTTPLASMPGASAGFLANNCGKWGYGSYLDGRYHIGVDYPAGAGTAVYSIGSGTVLLNGDFGGAWGRALFVQHKAADGSDFVALYGHLTNTVATGTTVAAGTRLGTVITDHLHFGIRPGTTYPSSGWGMMPCWSWAGTNGFVDPMPYLNAHSANAPAPVASVKKLKVNFTRGDNRSDIVWYEQGAGSLAALNSSGSFFDIGWKATGIGPAGWKATGDFNGDGLTDIAWHEGSTITVFTSSGSFYDIAWRMTGIGAPTWASVGDFTGDGKDDIAWYEQGAGSLAAFVANGTGTGFDIGWKAYGIGAPTWAGVGQFTSGDRRADIAWHEGSTITTFTSSGSFFDVGWRVNGIGAPTWASVGDFTGDGKDDIVWYEQGAGSLAAFVSTGHWFDVGWKAYGIGRPSWAGVGDFTGEGRADIAWHEGSTITTFTSSGSFFDVGWKAYGIGAPTWASNGSVPLH